MYLDPKTNRTVHTPGDRMRHRTMPYEGRYIRGGTVGTGKHAKEVFVVETADGAHIMDLASNWEDILDEA